MGAEVPAVGALGRAPPPVSLIASMWQEDRQGPLGPRSRRWLRRGQASTTTCPHASLAGQLRTEVRGQAAGSRSQGQTQGPRADSVFLLVPARRQR